MTFAIHRLMFGLRLPVGTSLSTFFKCTSGGTQLMVHHSGAPCR